MVNMTPEECIKTCCVIRCKNTPLNSKVNFFSFPEIRCGHFQSFQRDKWVQAIKDKNGQWWLPNEHSLICSEHFVRGRPCSRPQDEDYVPTVFVNRSRADLKMRGVTLKKFALEYIKHDALLERPCSSNIKTDQRHTAYVKLAAALCIPLTTARSWEKRFREYFKQKMAEKPDRKKRTTDGAPHWLTLVAQRLCLPPKNTQRGGLSPDSVVRALAAAARARRALCSTALYNDVKRALRLPTPINDLHAVWVAAQRVSLQQVCVWARAGDAGGAAPPHASPPPHVRAVADLVLLHSDVDMHRLVTDESVTLYEEAAALHTLWQLVQRHQLEHAEPGPSRELGQRWTRAHQDYIDSGRFASLVVLQRRWHELKLQARVRLAAHWRRATTVTPPHDMYPRPAPIHIQILKRYPHVATGAFKSWRQLVQDGAIVTEPLKEGSNVDENNDSTKKTHSIIEKEVEPTLEAPDTDAMDEGPAVVEPGSAENAATDTKPTGDKPDTETAKHNEALIKQSTAVDPLAVKSTDNEQSIFNSPSTEKRVRKLFKTVFERKIVRCPENISLFKQKKSGDKKKRKKSDLLVVNQAKTQDNDFSNKPSVEHDPLAEIPLKSASCPPQPSLAELAPSLAELAPSLAELAPSSGSGTQGTVSNKHIHHNEGTQANSLETDSDDDNLVIDECSNKTPSPLKLEPVPRTDRHSVDTVLAPKTFGTIAPTIAVLQMIDPSTVKTEIVFDSDEEDFQPCIEEDRFEIEMAIKKEPSFIADKLVFADEEPALSCDVNREDDFTERIDTDVTQRMDCDVTQGLNGEDTEHMNCDVTETATDELVADTATIDPKLLLDTEVRLFKIDKIKAWKKNVRKDNSIKPSRIHWRFHTPNPAAYYRTKSGRFIAVNPKHNNDSPKSDKDTPKSDNDTPKGDNDKQKGDNDNLEGDHFTPKGDNDTAKGDNDTPKGDNDKPKGDNNTFNSDDNTMLQETEIKLEASCLDKVANTESVKELSRTIKRELIDEQLESVKEITPYKRIKTESDEEDDQPLLMIRENKPTTSDTEVEQPESADDSDTVLSSDDEYLYDDWSPQQWRWRRTASRAAAAMSCTGGGARVAKRVRLPDREQLRRHAVGTPVAQVAPISSMTEGDKKSSVAEPPTDAAEDDTPLAWRALDLPARDQLEAALDELTSASASAAAGVLESRQCCAARRQRDISAARRRLGAADADVPLHNHPDGECTCCCAHLLEGAGADADALLGQELQTLYADIQRLLTKAAEGKSQCKPPQKRPCSPSPVLTKIKPKPASKDMPSTITTEAKKSKTKAKPATYTNRSRKRPKKAQEEPPAAPIDYYEEWQRQKTLNAKYFYINSCSDSKKDKRTNLQSTAPNSTSPQGTTQKSITPQCTTPESTAPNSMTLQGTTPESAAPQTTTPKSTARKSTTPKSTTPQCKTPKITSPQNTVMTSTTSQSVVTLRNSAGGLMPYIRQSRLVTADTRTPHTLQLPTLLTGSYPLVHLPYPVAVPYPVGIPYPIGLPLPVGSDNRAFALPDSPLHRTANSSEIPSPSLHKKAISSGLKEPSLHTKAISAGLPAPSLHKNASSAGLPEPLLHKNAISAGLPAPSLHKKASSAGLPQPSLHKNAISAGLPEPLLHKKAISTGLPAPWLHKKSISAGLSDPSLHEKAVSTELPDPPLHKIAISALPPAPWLHKKTISSKLSGSSLHTTRKPTLAPKPESMRLASMARHHNVKEKQKTQDTAISTTSATCDPQPRCINMTTEQVTAPQAPTSEPVTKSVSILEEYSRTFSSDPVTNLPMVNAVSIRVPDGAQGQKTTVLLSLNLPLKDIAKQTKDCLYANDKIDLTEEPEDSAVKPTDDAQKTPVVDIVGMVNSLLKAGNKNNRSLLKHSNISGPPQNDNLEKSTNQKHKPPAIMSLSNKLHDGDIIEIDDDSDDDGKLNKSPIVINKSTHPVVYSNKSSNISKCGYTKAVNQTVTDEKNLAIASTSSINKSSKQATRNINRKSIEVKSRNAKIFIEPVSGTGQVSNQAAASTSSINKATSNAFKNIGAIEMSYNKDTEAIKPTNSKQATSSTNNEIKASIESTTSDQPTTTRNTNKNNVKMKEIINKKYAEAMRRVPTANQTTLTNMCKIAAIRHTNSTESASNVIPEGATDNGVAQRTQELSNYLDKVEIDDQPSDEVADQ